MDEFVAEYGIVILGGLAAVLLLLLIIQLRTSARLRRMERRYKQMLGESGVPNLEHIIGDLQLNLQAQIEHQVDQGREIGQLAKLLDQRTGKIGFMRYNAFGDHGNDMSFSLALLNSNQDGVVVSGIHNHAETYVYAKPVAGGTSKYTLTPEEQQVISQAAEKQ